MLVISVRPPGSTVQQPWCLVSSKADGQLVLQIACSSSGLCPGTTALVLTTVTAPVITLVTSTYLSSVVEVKQVSMPGLFAFCFQLH